MKSSITKPLVVLFVCMVNAAAIHAATPSGKMNPAAAASQASAGPNQDALPPSKLPLHLLPHERIALVGGSLAERMNLFGNFESLLHSRFPSLELVVRNFARPCDAVDNRQRPNNYTALDDPLRVFGVDTFLCFFGFNESFAGAPGEDQFRTAYGKYLDEMAQQYPRSNGKSP